MDLSADLNVSHLEMAKNKTCVICVISIFVQPLWGSPCCQTFVCLYVSSVRDLEKLFVE